MLYRAFTSLPRSITAGDGLPIHGVYGLLSVILKLTRDLEAKAVAVAFDVPDRPTFRHELYPLYQAQRGPLGGENAEDFARQIDIARTVLPQIDIPAITAPGYEADDVLGTLASHIDQDRSPAIIVSTDRDLLQLVGPGTEVLVPGNPPARVRDSEAVMARIGVSPSGVPTYKSMAGDASDNIPGVQGIGAKTAAVLVNTLGTLENIYDSLPSLPPRTAKALQLQREDAFLFRTIVTVVTNLDLSPEAFRLPEVRFAPEERARAILDRLGYGRA